MVFITEPSFLIMFTKVCDVFSTKLSVKLFGELLA